MSEIATQFLQRFGRVPHVIRAPGRINLIGEHTDYNQGFVLPAAINLGIDYAIAANGSSGGTLISADLGESLSFELGQLAPSNKRWANYLLGVIDQFEKGGHALEGFDCVFGGNIPIGAGLSSSAAIECGLALGLNELFQGGLDRMALAHLAQRAEHSYPGVQCGLMDQFASLMGKEGQVVRLDCRSLAYAYFPFDTGRYRLLLCDTKVSHSLADTAYNTRRQECEAGVNILQTFDPKIQSLRDVSLDMLSQHQAAFDPLVYQRCHFVVSENARVLAACAALEAGNMDHLGTLMYQSHAGLQHEYEVSCAELDFLVDQTRSDPRVLGSRMMGGGFGGCTLNLIPHAAAAEVGRQLALAYEYQFGQAPGLYEVQLSEGVNLIA